jgi:hypothetical protein
LINEQLATLPTDDTKVQTPRKISRRIIIYIRV